MHIDRITNIFNSETKSSKYVLYWMQQANRISFNHALLKAIEIANQEKLPVLVVFSATFSYLGANLRHFTFILEGLKEVKADLKELGITFHIDLGKAIDTLPKYLNDAHTLVMDMGYLKPQKLWRKEIYEYIKFMEHKPGLVLVESDVIVPVKKAYDKLAYGAYVLRPNIMRKIALYRDFRVLDQVLNQTPILLDEVFNLEDIEGELKRFEIDRSVKPYKMFKGGYKEAIKHLKSFILNHIKSYDLRSDPALSIQSYLSIYLHFGHISSLEIYAYVTELFELGEIEVKVYEQFIEQLVVRRELAFNFVTYNKDYDIFEKMTEPWAYQTMDIHKDDQKLFIYTKEDIENAKTHDIYFNAAMKEMRITGFMANYMRMYWAKKIMEWSTSMKDAYEIIVDLNNKYFLDGRDANSYVNIAWCFGKMDRAFTERAIFGKLRYMNDNGLKRKFDMTTYLKKIASLEG